MIYILYIVSYLINYYLLRYSAKKVGSTWSWDMIGLAAVLSLVPLFPIFAAIITLAKVIDIKPPKWL